MRCSLSGVSTKGSALIVQIRNVIGRGHQFFCVILLSTVTDGVRVAGYNLLRGNPTGITVTQECCITYSFVSHLPVSRDLRQLESQCSSGQLESRFRTSAVAANAHVVYPALSGPGSLSSLTLASFPYTYNVSLLSYLPTRTSKYY